MIKSFLNCIHESYTKFIQERMNEQNELKWLSKQEIQDLLKRSVDSVTDVVLYTRLKTLYDNQTDDEQLNGTTIYANGIGLNKVTSAQKVKQMLDVYEECGRWKHEELAYVKKVLKQHMKQFLKIFIQDNKIFVRHKCNKAGDPIPDKFEYAINWNVERPNMSDIVSVQQLDLFNPQ